MFQSRFLLGLKNTISFDGIHNLLDCFCFQLYKFQSRGKEVGVKQHRYSPCINHTCLPNGSPQAASTLSVQLSTLLSAHVPTGPVVRNFAAPVVHRAAIALKSERKVASLPPRKASAQKRVVDARREIAPPMVNPCKRIDFGGRHARPRGISSIARAHSPFGNFVIECMSRTGKQRRALS